MIYLENLVIFVRFYVHRQQPNIKGEEMKGDELKRRLSMLKKEIERANHNYYVKNVPDITDYEYDLLMNELIAIEHEHPELVTPDSPTQKVGSDLQTGAVGAIQNSLFPEYSEYSLANVVGKGQESGFKQYRHKFPMLSLGNTYDENELFSFNERIVKSTNKPFSYVCELKFDGTAICLTYKNGKLFRALTRGDGTVGDDVTENVKQITVIPQNLKEGGDFPLEFEIRGEIYMPYSAFDKLNLQRERDEEQPFANPRNAAAGSLKLLDSSLMRERGLESVLYHLIAPEYIANTHSQSIEAAARWGFPVSGYSKICLNVNEVINYIREWDSRRKFLPFPTDGIVVKVNEFDVQKSLGYTAKAPRWATAYKFKPEEAVTKLKSIDYQVGRTGAITPVANLDPVQLSGTMVKRATLHNAEQMELLDIHIGDYVFVEKGGEIIPKITRVDLSKRDSELPPAVFPLICPDCGATLIKDEDEAKTFCPNADGCPTQIKGKFIHFISRKAMNINAGDATIERLYEKGYIKELSDLYKLTPEMLLTLSKWKEKSVSNFITSLNESKKVPFERVLYAIGIRFIGETTAKSLALKFKNIETLASASREELLATDDVGEKLADSIIDYFSKTQHLKLINELRAAGIKLHTDNKEKELLSTLLEGKTILVTGLFSIPRDNLKALIEAHGGKTATSISKNTTYLIAGEKAGGAKLQKAEKEGVEILSEEQFYEKINNKKQTLF